MASFKGARRSHYPEPSIRQLRRFLLKTPKDETVPCWGWSGAIDSKKRPYFNHHGARVLAREWIYHVMVTELESNAEVESHCNNYKCVNPNHLCAVTIEPII